MRTLATAIVTGLVLLAAPEAAAQTSAQLKKELRTREGTIDKKDADGFVELAKWAREQGLLRDYKRLLDKALKIDPDHEGANTERGMVRVEGEWVTRAKAEVLRQKAIDAAMKEQGFVKVDGVWVDKEQVADAKKGIFWHEGERVSKAEKAALGTGQVRHPRTGMFIDPADAEKAAADQFPTHDGRWLDLGAANEYHATPDHPWIVRTTWGVIISTMPLDKIEAYKSAVDSAIESVLPVFLGQHPPPSQRPVVWICGTTDEYRQAGTQFGAGGSAYGAFLSEAIVEIRGLGARRPAFANDIPDWGPYYVKDAAALAVTAGHCAANEIEAPRWFVRGVGSLAERFQVPGQTAHFGRQHIQKGGVKNVKSFISAFSISGEMESRAIDYNIFQAGLLLDYAMRGGDEKALEAMQAVSEALVEEPRTASKAFDKLDKVLSSRSDEIQSYLQQLTR